MNLPIVISHEVTALANSGGEGPEFTFFQEIEESPTWTLETPSSIASAQEIGEDRESEIVWDNYRLGAISAHSGTPYWLSFRAPQPGLIKIVRKWNDRFLFVYLLSNPVSWFISSSETDPDFKRLHGNALVIDVNFTVAQVQNVIREILRCWLRLNNPGIIIRTDLGTGESNRNIIRQSDLNSLSSSSSPEGKRRLANQISFAQTHDGESFKANMFMPGHDFVLPAPWQNTHNNEIAIPLISFGAANTRQQIKIALADIPFDPSRSKFQFNEKWTWFNAKEIIDRINPVSAGIRPLSNSNKVFAWYPLTSSLLTANRIRTLESGFFSLLNPNQSTQQSSGVSISPTTLFCSTHNPLKLLTGAESTNWSRRELNSNKQPINSSFLAIDDDGTADNNASITIPVINPDAAYIQVRANTNVYISIPQRKEFSIDVFRRDLVAICMEEYDFWHITHPNAVETNPGAIRTRLADYWNNGAPWNSLGLDNANLNIGTWQSANPWSATFVSWSIRKALDRQGIPRNQHRSFFYWASKHIQYIRWAKNGRVNNILEQNYWLYDLDETEIEPGDLIAKNRRDPDTGIMSTNTFDNLSQGNLTHTDIVTEVLADRIIVIGGNVIHNVDKKTIFLDSSGHIDLTKMFFQGPAFPDAYPAAHPIGVDNWENSNFFAILKLRRGIL